MERELEACDLAIERANALPAWLASLVPHAFEIACLLIYAAVLCWELFVPPFVGMANNSDFSRVLGVLSMGPERPINDDPYQKNLDYFVSDYTTARRWKQNLWMFSSEIPMVWICREAARLITRRLHFDIRYFGALNASILLVAFSMALAYLRGAAPLTRYVIPLVLIVIFTDASYVCPLNSFYTDAASIVFLLCTVALACRLAGKPAHVKWAWAFVLAAALLTTSKSQHALLGLPAAAASMCFAYRAGPSAARALLWSGAIVLVVLVPLMARTPQSFQNWAAYNIVFLKMAKLSPDPLRVLADLGLPPGDAQLIGMNANDALADSVKSDIQKKVTFPVAMRYYLSHPKLLFTILDTDLRSSTHPIKAPFANYRKEDGFPPWSESLHHQFWSRNRSRLNKQFPYNLVLLYIGLLILICSPRFRRHELFPVAGFLLTAGCLEFVVASLGDALDMSRHLTIFHAVTELVIVFFLTGMLNLIQPWFDRLRQCSLCL